MWVADIKKGVGIKSLLVLWLVSMAVIVWVLTKKIPEPVSEPNTASNRWFLRQSPESRNPPYSAAWQQIVPPHYTSPKFAAEKLNAIPEAWEEPLFQILVSEEQDMGFRNSRLVEMATKTAVGVPSVQRECLSHLAFGLSDSDQGTFLALIKNSSIPENIRADFFGEVLNMRPSFLSGWLSDKMRDHTERTIRSLAREYLTDLHAQN